MSENGLTISSHSIESIQFITMRWFKVRDFFESTRPVYLAARICLLHFETVDFRERKFRKTLFDQIRFILTMWADLYLASVAIGFGEAFMSLSESTLLNAGYFASIIDSYLFMLSLPTWNRWMAASIFAIFEHIAEVDDELKQLGLTINHQKHHFVSTVVMASATTLENNTVTVQSSEVSCQMIRKFTLLHDKLCETIKLFNRCFSLQMMVALACTFSYTLFAAFGLIHSFAARVNEGTLELALSNMVMDGFYVFFMIQLTVISSLTYNEGTRTVTLVHKIISYGSYDRKTLRQLQMFSYQLWNRAPKISCRLLDFDWSLFYTVAASLTTYLLILVQFDVVNFY
ncbi:uncharacterized protein LOC129729125 [Wyeomyia smithii]|uniref:uncharacterized protein LOC129729125 n=1 Tax=Wyeomyia smithii TaxID=174621 RepID=UPI002467BA16|nr:uncharacterized protein LOC129729125 [Wyeomyia smithii]